MDCKITLEIKDDNIKLSFDGSYTLLGITCKGNSTTEGNIDVIISNVVDFIKLSDDGCNKDNIVEFLKLYGLNETSANKIKEIFK